MIKGKHQYAVFNLSEGRLTYHPYWLAAWSIPPSTKRLRSLWKTEEMDCPGLPPCHPPSCMMAEAKAADVCKPPDSATTTPGWWSWSSYVVSLSGATAMPAQRTKTWTWYKPKPISLILSLVSGCWRNPIPHLKSSILGVWMTSSFTLMGSLVRSTKLLHEAVKVDLFNQLLLNISFGWLKWSWIHHEIAFLRPEGQNGLMRFYLCMRL